jgi:hypothetical protein
MFKAINEFFFGKTKTETAQIEPVAPVAAKKTRAVKPAVKKAVAKKPAAKKAAAAPVVAVKA